MRISTPRLREQLRAAGVALELGGHRRETFTTADLLVLSPGVPLDQAEIVAAAGRRRARDWRDRAGVALADRSHRRDHRARKANRPRPRSRDACSPQAGFKTLVGGNIGTPLSSQVAASTPETFHIVEVSSFQLETTETFHPWIAVLLNLSSDHLDRHGSMEVYGAAKAKIFANQTPDDWAVINADDPQTLALARARARTERCCFRANTPLVPLIVDTPHRPAPGRRCDGGGDGGADCGRASRGDRAGRRIVHRSRARARARGGRGRRSIRQRFEGDKHRGRTTRDRELRYGPRRDHGRAIQERGLFAPARAAPVATRQGGRHRRSDGR